ncbi:MAG TPA: hypothetical protein VGH28_18900 [Polyangiaceae bacterium]|jgi:hypothetical protein
MLRRALPLIALVACGHAEAPLELGFTGKCALSVPADSPGLGAHVRTPNEAKTHVDLQISHSVIVVMHVELPDGRSTTVDELVPDDPLLTGDATPNVPIDPETDLEVPVEVTRKDVQNPWDLQIRLRFHGRTADAVVGRMHVTGDCVPDKKPE